MTRLSCDRCREIEARGGTVPEWAMDWWQRHKQEDEERLRTETAAVESAVIRARAIRKLSREEREELGV